MRTLVKKEFEIIEQGDAEGLLSNKQFKLLRDFVFDSAESAPDFFKLISKNGKEAIKVQNYVGVVELPDGFRIEILPKIDLAEDDIKCDKTRNIFLKMLQCMDENQFKVSDFANLNTFKMPLFEIFIQMFLNDVQKLTRVGLKSGYVHVEENSKTFKGKLLVSQNIRENLVHQERFYVEYDEFQLNRPENRLIKSTLLYLNKKSNSDSNLAEIRRQLMFFEQVDASVNYEADFSKVIKNRNTTEYENLMAWARVFLQNKSFSTFSGNTSVRSILFPMEKVFEAYVAKMLRKAVIKETTDDYWSEWNVHSQYGARYLFESPSNKFRMRPDIVMKKNDKINIILDTKWKRLVNDDSLNYGISQQDMYQMFAYGHKYNCPNIWLIYPQNKDMDGEIKEYKEFKDRNDGLSVSIYCLYLGDKDAFSTLLAQLKEEK
ncbi:MAG: McrC family protein [Fibrobacteraceae bacterium]|nr:McrC family protein [Fibrobacteraceae bacterium]